MCLIHKWQYKIEKRNESLAYDVAIRTCVRCFKKQKTNMGAGIWNFRLRNYIHGWEPVKLTKKESRDLKLKKLLSNN